MKCTFSETYRIAQENEFFCVLQKGKKIRRFHLVVSCVRSQLPYMRMGISIGKKFGKAHCRNRFKRIIREAFRTYPSRYALGLDIVVMPSPKNRTLDSHLLREELHSILKDAEHSIQGN